MIHRRAQTSNRIPDSQKRSTQTESRPSTGYTPYENPPHSYKYRKINPPFINTLSRVHAWLNSWSHERIIKSFTRNSSDIFVQESSIIRWRSQFIFKFLLQHVSFSDKIIQKSLDLFTETSFCVSVNDLTVDSLTEQFYERKSKTKNAVNNLMVIMKEFVSIVWLLFNGCSKIY